MGASFSVVGTAATGMMIVTVASPENAILATRTTEVPAVAGAVNSSAELMESSPLQTDQTNVG